MENGNPRKNPEVYTDTVPHEVLKSIGVSTKAYYCYETITHVAKLAGFEVTGTVLLKDRNGNVHDGAELKRRKTR